MFQNQNTTIKEFQPLNRVDALPSYIQKITQISRAVVDLQDMVGNLRKLVGANGGVELDDGSFRKTGETSTLQTKKLPIMDTDAMEVVDEPLSALYSSTPNYELEASFGFINQQNKFIPGVNADVFNSILSLLESGKWEKTKNIRWKEQHDYFYTLPKTYKHKEIAGQTIRTSIVFSTSTLPNYPHESNDFKNSYPFSNNPTVPVVSESKSFYVNSAVSGEVAEDSNNSQTQFSSFTPQKIKRTECLSGGGGGEEESTYSSDFGVISHLIKNKIEGMDFQSHWTRRTPSKPPIFEDFIYDVRIKLSEEYNVKPEFLPEVVADDNSPEALRKEYPHLEMVCIKQRRSFLCSTSQPSSSSSSSSIGTNQEKSPEENGTVFWRYDLSRRWVGRTRQEAELNQRTKEPILEVEVELVNPQVYLTLTHHNNLYVSTSILLKMYDLVTHPDQFYWEKHHPIY